MFFGWAENKFLFLFPPWGKIHTCRHFIWESKLLFSLLYIHEGFFWINKHLCRKCPVRKLHVAVITKSDIFQNYVVQQGFKDLLQLSLS